MIYLNATSLLIITILPFSFVEAIDIGHYKFQRQWLPTNTISYKPISTNWNLKKSSRNRRYGRNYLGYSSNGSDSSIFKWLAFTAITFTLLDHLNEEQQRKHETAQIIASTSNIDEVIKWSDGSVSGSVTTIKTGTTSSGRHCREFRQTITVGDKNEEAYGTACLKEDGACEIIN